MPHRGREGEADEGLDIQLVHQAQPRVLLGLQWVRGQRVWVGSKNSMRGSGTPYQGLTLVSPQHPPCKTSANPCAHPSTHKTGRVEAGASSQRYEIIHKYIKNTQAAPSPLPNFRPLVATATAGEGGQSPCICWGGDRDGHGMCQGACVCKPTRTRVQMCLKHMDRHEVRMDTGTRMCKAVSSACPRGCWVCAGVDPCNRTVLHRR